MTIGEHRREAPSGLNVRVLTVSDTLSEGEVDLGEDKSGSIIQRRLEKVGFTSSRAIVPDEEEKIRKELERFVADSEIDAMITTGGTGITSRDKTVDVVREFLDKELSGFGELLRLKSQEDIGEAVILTRATGGLIDQKPIFCLPGSPNSVEIGMDLILPDLAHVVKHARE